MRMRIDKAGQNDPADGINNFAIYRFFFDLRARSNDADLTVADEHPAVANDREIGHFVANAWPVRTRQRHKLRCVKNSDRLQD